LWAWFVACLLAQGAFSGCTVASLVGANSEPPPITRDLHAGSRRVKGRFDAQLLVQEPAAVEALSSSRIAIKPGPGEISYFAASEWSDKLPRLLQMRLAQVLENSRAARAVSTGSDRIRADYALVWTIRDFQIEVNHGAARANARFFVKIVSDDRGELVAEREFSAASRAANAGVIAGVEALDRAFNAAALKIMRWLARLHVAPADNGEELIR
jgi:cholesterol transport system auxiliary component